MTQSTVADLEHPILLTLLRGWQEGGAKVSVWRGAELLGYLNALEFILGFGRAGGDYYLSYRQTWRPYGVTTIGSWWDDSDKEGLSLSGEDVEKIKVTKIGDNIYYIYLHDDSDSV